MVLFNNVGISYYSVTTTYNIVIFIYNYGMLPYNACRYLIRI